MGLAKVAAEARPQVRHTLEEKALVQWICEHWTLRHVEKRICGEMRE